MRDREESTPRSRKSVTFSSPKTSSGTSLHGKDGIPPSHRKASIVTSATKSPGTPRCTSSRVDPSSPRPSTAMLPTTSSLKAQLDKVRYPAGRQDQQRSSHQPQARRVVTTQITGTPRHHAAKGGHRREGTAPESASSPVKGLLSSSPIRRPESASKGSRPCSRMAMGSPRGRPESVARVGERSSLHEGSPLGRPGSAMRGARPASSQSASPLRSSESAMKEARPVSPMPMLTRTPSKLKLRKSTSVVRKTGGSPAKTPANSPASSRSSGVAIEPLGLVKNK